MIVKLTKSGQQIPHSLAVTEGMLSSDWPHLCHMLTYEVGVVAEHKYPVSPAEYFSHILMSSF
jgi:hypothetical protein